MKKELQEKTSGTVKKDKRKKIALIVCGVVIVALVIVIVALLWKGQGDKKKRNVVVTKDRAEEMAEEMANDTTPQGYYTVTMNAEWKFEDGKSASSNAYIENAKNNSNAVYFELIRDDTQEVLLESPIIPVGSYMNEVTLDKKLAAGNYNCTCKYHLLDENEETISEVNMGVTLKIQN